MAAYCIFQIQILDPDGFLQYAQEVPETIRRHGGEYLVRGGAYEVLEGEWPQRRVVVLRFPSMEHARAWYESEDYAGPKALRTAASRADAILVEGV